MMTRLELGAWGELYVMGRLIEAGWSADFGQQGRDSDVVAISPQGIVHQIEVKSARKGKDNKWRATLIKDGHTNHNKADVVVFICQNSDELTFFVVPVEEIRDCRVMVISSNPRTYNGRWSAYRKESLVI